MRDASLDACVRCMTSPRGALGAEATSADLLRSSRDFFFSRSLGVRVRVAFVSVYVCCLCGSMLAAPPA